MRRPDYLDRIDAEVRRLEQTPRTPRPAGPMTPEQAEEYDARMERDYYAPKYDWRPRR